MLAGFEPEDEAGAIFLRLRKAALHHGTRVLAIAPFTTRGLTKMNGTLLPTAPGDEPAALSLAARPRRPRPRQARSVVLVGERLATVPGALSAAAELAAKTGARLAWVPRRAGDRGAIETGCLPGLLPGGRPGRRRRRPGRRRHRVGRRQPARDARPRRRRASSPPCSPASSADS